jgi:four helix bundle protein
MNNEERKRALRQRTKEFAGCVVRLFVGFDKHREELRIIGKQLIRSATSVAANYLACEIAR